MNIKENPFLQLDVIKRIASTNRKIGDCYRLLYQKGLWIKAFETIYHPDRNIYMPQKKRSISTEISLLIDECITDLRLDQTPFSHIIPLKPFRLNMIDPKQKMKIKLTIEVIRMILESIYSPPMGKQSNWKYPFSYEHNALLQIKEWSNYTWIIQVQIDNLLKQIRPKILSKILKEKIADDRFINLINKTLFLRKTEYDSFQLTLTKTSSLDLYVKFLFYIYLIEMEHNLAYEFSGNDSCRRDCKNKNNLTENSTCHCNVLRKNTRIGMVMVANEFVIRIVGSKSDAHQLLSNIEDYLLTSRAVLLDNHCYKIKHHNQYFHFLGFDIRKHDSNKSIKRNKAHNVSTKLSIEIPQRIIRNYAVKNGYGNVDQFIASHRAYLVSYSELAILKKYNMELREIVDYYFIADNSHHLRKLIYLARSSFIKTIAYKRRTTAKKVAKQMKSHGNDAFGILYKNQKGKSAICQFFHQRQINNKYTRNRI